MPGDDRRPPARPGETEEDGRAHGDLPAETGLPARRAHRLGQAADLAFAPAPLATFRADPFIAGFRGAIDQVASTAELEHVATLIPEQWLAPAATGSPERCVEVVQRQFDLGADGVILHGASPLELEPIVLAYREHHAQP